MRAHELLLEYDRSREQQRIQSIPAYQQRIQQDTTFSLDQLEQADPTSAKSYVPRLATWWLQGTPLEDLVSRGADALSKYQQLKQKNQLKPEHRDVGRFKKFADFETAMRGYQVAEPAAKEDRGKYKEIFRDDELVVVKLLDETAAKFWGRNTQWCTAADKHNMFNNYFKDGPIFVISPRHPIRPGERYQYWFSKTEKPYYHATEQFMNEEDVPVEPLNLRFFPKLKNIFSKINNDLKWKTNPTEDEQIRAVRQAPTVIRYINNPSEAVKLEAVARRGSLLNDFENPSEELKLAAVKNRGEMISRIKNPSREIKLAAVMSDGTAIRFIQNPDLTIKKAAVQSAGAAIKFIRNPSLSLQITAVERYGDAIKYIKNPAEKTQIASVTNNPWSIQFIKDPSESAQLAAVKIEGTVISHIDNPTEAVKIAAVKSEGAAIKYIKNPTEKMQLIAVKSGVPLYTIANPSEAVQLMAVKLRPNAIYYISEPSERVQLAAVSREGRALLHIYDPSPAVIRAARRAKAYPYKG